MALERTKVFLQWKNKNIYVRQRPGAFDKNIFPAYIQHDIIYLPIISLNIFISTVRRQMNFSISKWTEAVLISKIFVIWHLRISIDSIENSKLTDLNSSNVLSLKLKAENVVQ